MEKLKLAFIMGLLPKEIIINLTVEEIIEGMKIHTQDLNIQSKEEWKFTHNLVKWKKEILTELVNQKKPPIDLITQACLELIKHHPDETLPFVKRIIKPLIIEDSEKLTQFVSQFNILTQSLTTNSNAELRAFIGTLYDIRRKEINRSGFGNGSTRVKRGWKKPGNASL
ncbi:hypothetical protein KO317_00920 [Candidatus Micrarchaeota archaeon]|jgi:hypothetical protein|nr:hypothetical protein [Candidatus Micrarchaeota archaeon]